MEGGSYIEREAASDGPSLLGQIPNLATHKIIQHTGVYTKIVKYIFCGLSVRQIQRLALFHDYGQCEDALQ